MNRRARGRLYRALLPALVLAVGLAGCEGERGDGAESRDPGDPPSATGSPAPGSEASPPVTADPDPSRIRPEATEGWPPARDSIPGTPWTREDWEIFRATLEQAEALGIDTLPLGEAVGAMGMLFLGSPYVPRTLEVPGPERLVINFRGLDCVTFVENVLALTRFSRRHGTALLDDPEEARARYEADLTTLRYRNGRVEGYASRMHYFSEWVRRNAEAGRLDDFTGVAGGIPDEEPIDFMSTHAEAYPQLADPEVLEEIREVEAELNAGQPPLFIPQHHLVQAEELIRTGDVIAARSTVEGLDVAHTGIALWRDGVLHLLHAPLVGSNVVLSQGSLAERIKGIRTQDGAMVARPAGPWFGERRR